MPKYFQTVSLFFDLVKNNLRKFCYNQNMKSQDITKAITHLSQDERLKKVIDASPRPDFLKNEGRDLNQADPFEALVRSIIYQQLSGKAAGTILARFHVLFTNKKPTPKLVLKLESEQFKSVGISGQKTGYLRDLAEKFLDGTVDPQHFETMTDESIREHLIAVKGIGRWTADMFLMFTLHRPDVLPTGDLGIQKGFQKVFKMRSLPGAKKMEKLAKVWSPYRTVACWYLWRAVDSGDSDW